LFPLQHPVAQEVTLQTHWPDVVLQTWFAPQAAQAAPATPHSLFVCDAYATHVVPLQQPFGHELALQTHWPVLVLHVSPVPHALHAAPPAPHDMDDSADSASQVEPLQQPAQAPPPQLQVPLVQLSPLPHVLHAAPPVPHSEIDCEEYPTQVVPLQQPLEQDDALQTHCPVLVLHACPVAHGAQVAPPVPHEPIISAA
jgi:hypothetical protein